MKGTTRGSRADGASALQPFAAFQVWEAAPADCYCQGDFIPREDEIILLEDARCGGLIPYCN